MKSEQTDNNQKTTQYLLGALPEAESERLDELSLTDDEFADSLRVAENDLVDAYVQGELTGADLERFKLHYLASPLRRERVEFARVFQVFGEREGLGLQAKSFRSPPKPGWFAALSALIGPRPVVRWGLAAAALVLLVGGGGWLVVDNLRLRQQMSQAAARRDVLIQREQDLQKDLDGQRFANSQAEQELARVRDERERLEQELKARVPQLRAEGTVVSLILPPPLRGAGPVPTLSVRPGTNEVAVQLELDAADYSAYRVALIDPASNQMLWRSGNLKARTNGAGKAIVVDFAAHLLKPQNYILQVSGIAPNGKSEVMSDYPFKIVK